MASISGLSAALDRYDVLVLPGWHNSGAGHWQSRWEQLFPAFRRVQQDNWDTPQREDWIAALDKAISECKKPVLLIGHSLSCITIAHWARQHRHRVAGALLVAPADVERRTVSPVLRRFAPIPSGRLPFPALLIGSDNDRCCDAWRAAELADHWGAELHLAYGAGHINADSDLGDWPEGLLLLEEWLRGVEARRPGPWRDVAWAA